MLSSRKICAVLMACIGLYSVTTCAEEINTQTIGPQVYDESRTTITVTEQSPSFTIRLRSNPTTGYTWKLSQFTARFLTPSAHRFVMPETQMMGAPGFEEWSFQVKPNAFKTPTQSSITFVYERPWDAEEGEARKVVFTVKS